MRKLSLLLLALLVALALVVARAGRDKQELGAALAALPKNRQLAAYGVRQQAARIELLGTTHDVEFTFVHLPARRAGSAPPLVFVHGTPSTLFNWSALLLEPGSEPALAGDCDVYLLDALGHGQTTTTAPRYTFQACADWVRGFLRTLDLRGVTLVGQSYGGEFAWRAALDERERIAKLVLIDSSGYARPDGAWLSEERKLREWPGARFGYLLNSRERIRPAAQLHFERELTADQLEEFYLCCDSAENWRAMTELARDENGTRQGEISKLALPTLLLFGERDLAYPPERVGRAFERDIAGARLVVVPGAGHYVHEERVDVVRRELRAFHGLP